MNQNTLTFRMAPSPSLFPNPRIIKRANTTPAPTMNNETDISDVSKDIARIQTESLVVASSILDSLAKRLSAMSDAASKASTMAHTFQKAIELPLATLPLSNYDLTDSCQQLNKTLHELDHSRMLCILSYSALMKTDRNAKALIMEKQVEHKKRQEKRKYQEDTKFQKKRKL